MHFMKRFLLHQQASNVHVVQDFSFRILMATTHKYEAHLINDMVANNKVSESSLHLPQVNSF